ncbi:PLP-dependent transferase [Glarea lozoyensis ATCC 20868]|uniref:PLP-dependent transferase n=1 Tax=Glarea lozoyensis (strain ATCC 20868 / MF5171) TaxID=1116229 RepID=S3D742_GLAL2|nr:PLP-dependent transferase [Glarea lozoyensis ATCC 20868]EPE34302.1 PLP-dependent transferase [Glarea lozoyensis ATCC 20868]
MSKPINLQLGWPSTRLFPVEQLAEATQAALSDPEVASSALIYGPDLGYAPLRKSIASWLSSFYQPAAGEIPSERIAITGGASQNLANILQVFTDPEVTQRVWMVEPTYFLACTIFQDAGFSEKLRGVPENDGGIDVKWLRKALVEFEGRSDSHSSHRTKPSEQYQKIYRHVLYLTPTFSNPSAKTMGTNVREQLIDLVREYDILIISDDVYDFLRWPEEPTSESTKLTPIPPRLSDVDRATSSDDEWGNAISNGSFSKIVAPGVRVGWAEGSPKQILRLSETGSTRSGGAPSHLTSTFINHLLTSGSLQKHIDEVLIPTYQSRYRVLMTAIKQYLQPLGVLITTGSPYMETTENTTIVPAGGFFTYITFPPELPSADIIAKRAKEEYSLIFAYGEMFVVQGDKTSSERSHKGFGRGARLCWAWHEEKEMQEGIERLAKLLRIMLKECQT